VLRDAHTRVGLPRPITRLAARRTNTRHVPPCGEPAAKVQRAAAQRTGARATHCRRARVAQRSTPEDLRSAVSATCLPPPLHSQPHHPPHTAHTHTMNVYEFEPATRASARAAAACARRSLVRHAPRRPARLH
jgi:hypothetical protein